VVYNQRDFRKDKPKRCHPFSSAKNAEILLYLINFIVLRDFFVDILVSIGQTILRKNSHDAYLQQLTCLL